VAETFEVRHLCAHLRSFSLVRHKSRDSSAALRSARNDKTAVRETPNAEDARGPSFARAHLKFCVPPSSRALKINHEDQEGHEEFAVASR
jgi:hypothetical protein